MDVEALENENMGLADLLIVDYFNKFKSLDKNEKNDYISEILEKTLLNQKEETKELKELELEKNIENILKQNKLNEDKNTGIDIFA